MAPFYSLLAFTCKKFGTCPFLEILSEPLAILSNKNFPSPLFSKLVLKVLSNIVLTTYSIIFVFCFFYKEDPKKLFW